MQLFGIEIRRAKREKTGHDLTAEDRENGVAVRQMAAERRRMQHEIEKARLEAELLDIRQQIAEMKESFGDGDDGSDVDSIFSEILLRVFGGAPVSRSDAPPMPAYSPATGTMSVSDDAIKDMVKNVPAQYKQLAAAMSDDKLREYLQRNTQYDADSIDRAIRIFRTQNI